VRPSACLLACMMQQACTTCPETVQPPDVQPPGWGCATC
jgi:hypothetical protein